MIEHGLYEWLWLGGFLFVAVSLGVSCLAWAYAALREARRWR